MQSVLFTHTLLRKRKSRNAILNSVHFTRTIWTVLCKNENTKLDTKSILYTHGFAEYILTDKYLFKTVGWNVDHSNTYDGFELSRSEYRSVFSCDEVFIFLVVVSYYLSGPSFVRCL